MATGDAPDNGTVRYTIKELLDAINKKLDGFFTELTHKADAQAVVDLTARVQVLEEAARFEAKEETNREKGLTRFQSFVVILSSLSSTAALALSAWHFFH